MDDRPGKDQAANVLAVLAGAAETLPHRQRQICSYILNNYQKTAFQTVEALAEASKTSPATVVRTIKALGYNNFKDLQKEIHDVLFANNISVWWELERSLQGEDRPEDHEPTFNWTARDNVESIQNSATPQLLRDFTAAVDLLERAGKIAIFASRSTKAAAFYLYFMLQQLSTNTRLLDSFGADLLYDELLTLTKDDVFLALSIGGPHFGKRTLEAVAFAAQNNIPTILITTQASCPAAMHADITLYVAQPRRHYSIVSAITLVEALVVELGKRKKETSLARIRQLEKVLIEQKVTI